MNATTAGDWRQHAPGLLQAPFCEHLAGSLVHLDLTEFMDGPPAEIFCQMRHLTSLTSLTWSAVTVTKLFILAHQAMAHVACLRSLQALVLRLPIDSRLGSLADLSQLQALTRLELYGIASCKSILSVALPSLQDLLLGHSMFVSVPQELHYLAQLTQLHLGHTTLVGCIPALTNLSNLQGLMLDSCRLYNAASWSALGNAVSALSQLTLLSIESGACFWDYHYMEEPQYNVIPACLRPCSRLVHLHLWDISEPSQIPEGLLSLQDLTLYAQDLPFRISPAELPFMPALTCLFVMTGDDSLQVTASIKSLLLKLPSLCVLELYHKHPDLWSEESLSFLTEGQKLCQLANCPLRELTFH